MRRRVQKSSAHVGRLLLTVVAAAAVFFLLYCFVNLPGQTDDDEGGGGEGNTRRPSRRLGQQRRQKGARGGKHGGANDDAREALRTLLRLTRQFADAHGVVVAPDAVARALPASSSASSSPGGGFPSAASRPGVSAGAGTVAFRLSEDDRAYARQVLQRAAGDVALRPAELLARYFTPAAPPTDGGELRRLSLEAEGDLNQDGYVTQTVLRSETYWDSSHVTRRGYGLGGSIFVAVPADGEAVARAAAGGAAAAGGLRYQLPGMHDVTYVEMAECGATVRTALELAGWPDGVFVGTLELAAETTAPSTSSTSEGGGGGDAGRKDATHTVVFTCVPRRLTRLQDTEQQRFVPVDNVRTRRVQLPLAVSSRIQLDSRRAPTAPSPGGDTTAAHNNNNNKDNNNNNGAGADGSTGYAPSIAIAVRSSASLSAPVPPPSLTASSSSSAAAFPFFAIETARAAVLGLYRGETYVCIMRPGVLPVPLWDWAARLLHTHALSRDDVKDIIARYNNNSDKKKNHDNEKGDTAAATAVAVGSDYVSPVVLTELPREHSADFFRIVHDTIFHKVVSPLTAPAQKLLAKRRTELNSFRVVFPEMESGGGGGTGDAAAARASVTQRDEVKNGKDGNESCALLPHGSVGANRSTACGGAGSTAPPPDPLQGRVVALAGLLPMSDAALWTHVLADPGLAHRLLTPECLRRAGWGLTAILSSADAGRLAHSLRRLVGGRGPSPPSPTGGGGGRRARQQEPPAVPIAGSVYHTVSLAAPPPPGWTEAAATHFSGAAGHSLAEVVQAVAGAAELPSTQQHLRPPEERQAALRPFATVEEFVRRVEKCRWVSRAFAKPSEMTPPPPPPPPGEGGGHPASGIALTLDKKAVERCVLELLATDIMNEWYALTNSPKRNVAHPRNPLSPGATTAAATTSVPRASQALNDMKYFESPSSIFERLSSPSAAAAAAAAASPPPSPPIASHEFLFARAEALIDLAPRDTSNDDRTVSGARVGKEHNDKGDDDAGPFTSSSTAATPGGPAAVRADPFLHLLTPAEADLALSARLFSKGWRVVPVSESLVASLSPRGYGAEAHDTDDNNNNNNIEDKERGREGAATAAATAAAAPSRMTLQKELLRLRRESVRRLRQLLFEKLPGSDNAIYGLGSARAMREFWALLGVTEEEAKQKLSGP